MRVFERQIGPKLIRKFCPKDWRDDHVMLDAFGRAKHGEWKYHWFRAWVQEHWPEPIFYFDRWSEIFFSACCGYREKIEGLTGCVIDVQYAWWRYVLAAGGASSGKSSRCAMWFLANWLAEQIQTSCVLTSTSIEQLKKRVWSELLRWISDSRIGFQGVLEVVASDTLVREPTKDEPANTKRGIFGRAVDQGGSTQAAVDRIKGVHNTRMFVCTDEMTSMPEAITKACRNLKKGTKEFQFFGLANPSSHDDQHGVYCKPLHGWDSISVEDEVWLTEKGGICVHFDGMKSPGIKEPDKYHFYTNQEDIDEDIEFHGGENDPAFWAETRGFWASGGLGRNIMDTALLEQFHTGDAAIWKRGYTMCAAFDPAFEGGDRRVLQPFKLGEFDSGVMGMELMPPIVVAVDMTQDKRWLHYQISDAVQEKCENYESDGRKDPILPQNFMMDTSGEAGGLFSIMSGRWSPLIQACEFGGAADKEPMFPDRPTTWYEKYSNRVSMLWYVFRRFVEGGQIRGLTDAETKAELTGRRREEKLRGGKTAIEPKKEMKKMKHRSPDKADACVVAAELMRKRGVGFSGATGAVTVVTPDAWNKWAEQMNHDEESYSDAGIA